MNANVLDFVNLSAFFFLLIDVTEMVKKLVAN